MRMLKSRSEDSTFELNLAPMLDVIVAVIPMLLLSVAFIEVNQLDTPIPESVQKVIDKQAGEKVPSLTLQLSKAGAEFKLSEGTTDRKFNVTFENGKIDDEKIYQEALKVKALSPQLFTIEVSPSKDVDMQHIIKVVDSIRQTKDEKTQFQFTDKETGKVSMTRLMFPRMYFGNVGEL